MSTTRSGHLSTVIAREDRDVDFRGRRGFWIPMLSASDVIGLLDLKPHPEGGHFRETFRDPRFVESGRSASTAIYFLLARGERSDWHRIDATEVWHHYAGAPLRLEIAPRETGPIKRVTLGPDL